MGTAWTRLFEVEADRVAPILSRHGGVAATLYLWVLSRAFACENGVSVSYGFIANLFGVDSSTVKRAAKALANDGLITLETRRGNGGGTTFHIKNPLGLEYGANAPLNREQPLQSNAPNDAPEPCLTVRSRPKTKKGEISHADPEEPNLIALLDRRDPGRP